MIAQQLLGLVQELAFMLCAGSFITPSQLPQNLYPCRLTHCFIHSGHGNPTSGATYPFTALCTSSRVTKLLAQFDGSASVCFFCPSRQTPSMLRALNVD